jgi:hypothetical protein
VPLLISWQLVFSVTIDIISDGIYFSFSILFTMGYGFSLESLIFLGLVGAGV